MSETEVREKERSAIRTVGVFVEETGMTPEMKEFIEATIAQKVREMFQVTIREGKVIGEFSGIELTTPRTYSETEKKFVLQTIYDSWVGLLTFLTLISGYFTVGQILPFIPGILLTIACVMTLLLFIMPKVLRL